MAAICGGAVPARMDGSVAIYFYGSTLPLGLLIPAWRAWAGLSGPMSLGAIVVLAAASAAGDFFMICATSRAGVFLPVWTPLAPQR